jgi:hypothetical protein
MRRIATILTTLTLSALLLTPVASAQYYGPGSTPMNGSASGMSFTPGSDSTDPTGSVSITSGVLDGPIMGTPITGGLHIEEVRTRPVDAPNGSVQGQFTIADGFGNSIAGDLGGTFTVGQAGTNANGTFTVTSGTGRYAGASGSGTFTETVSDPSLGGAAVTFSSAAISLGGLPGVVPGPFPGVLPGASASAAAFNSNGLANGFANGLPSGLANGFANGLPNGLGNGLVPATTYSQPYLAPTYYDSNATGLTQQQAQAFFAAEAAARAQLNPAPQYPQYSSGDMACLEAITQNRSCNNDDATRTATSSSSNSRSSRR